ncbi:MAG: sulfite exporter TauE/SafE family protein [Brevundimonas sp.]|uniref:sulfite exporter TauE/SafE family protein n=1 Tax=Alphaproteobacteria TaxID=28211 RepID=UPI002724303C|nr:MULTISPECIES: sulfite exporter TauE/SafE family protein [Alphaproteobacteria]MDO9641314.1 sulfite exporter TauE/SafE family protein [Pseudotabrizicola sp.]MDP3369200.1 sulfite exporter TauE/SafE family protein [Brevundimonas sp.]MDP3656397.1 sulfite exporter TauE/SafE family protein [Brevundimonas sp.]MDZ4110885.1 sulfite exporter TauE/SafE family protein [Brevundimonas sp.]
MDATVAQLLLAVLSGGIVALLLTVFGGGGSVLAVPLLLYVVGVRDPHVAIGASAAGVSLNALTALAGHARAGRVRWPCALLFAGTGAVGAVAGSSVAKAIDGHALLLFFAFAMGLVALAMLRPNAPVGTENVRLNRIMAPRIAASGAGVGVAAGFFGIGGGFLIVPGLMGAAGMTLAVAQASSLVSVAAFGAATATNYAVSGLIDWPIVAAMAAGGGVGTLAGLPIARRLGANVLLGRRLFSGLILVVAVYVAIRAVTAL